MCINDVQVVQGNKDSVLFNSGINIDFNKYKNDKGKRLFYITV